VTTHRDDLPANGVPLSLLCDLAEQIRCDVISFADFDSAREQTWFLQVIRGYGEIRCDGPGDDPLPAAISPRPTTHCSLCSARTCTRRIWTPSAAALIRART